MNKIVLVFFMMLVSFNVNALDLGKTLNDVNKVTVNTAETVEAKKAERKAKAEAKKAELKARKEAPKKEAQDKKNQLKDKADKLKEDAKKAKEAREAKKKEIKNILMK